MLDLYFNDVRIPSWISVTNITESILPSLTVTEESTELKEIEFKINFRFKKNQLIDIKKKQEFVYWLKGDNFNNSKLILPGRSQYYYMAKVKDISDINGTIKKGTGTITFIAYKGEMVENIQNNIVFNSGEKKILYDGDIEVYPVLTFKVVSSCNSINLEYKKDDIVSNIIINNRNFIAGDILVLNQATNKLTINNSIDMSLWSLRSRRHTLTSGINKYKIIEGNVEVKISWENKYY